MKTCAAFVAALAFSVAALFPSSSDACTKPEKEAENPTATPAGGTPGSGDGPGGAVVEGGTGTGSGGGSGDGSGSGSGGGSGDGSGSGSGSGTGSDPGGGLVEGGTGTGSGGGSGDGSGGGTSGGSSGGGFVEGGGGTGTGGGSSGGGFVEGSGGTGSGAGGGEFVELAWSPGRDVDADPNNSAYYQHGGHRIATRVVVLDLASGRTVRDQLVAQFDYENAVRGKQMPTLASHRLQLAPGRYQAFVQSVFLRHGEVKFGLRGQWQDDSALQKPPAVGADVDSVSFVVQPRASGAGGLAEAVSGGCSSTSAAAPGLTALAMLLGALWGRRRRAGR